MARLRNYTLRWIPDAEVRDYLLDLNHPDGGPKARFFIHTCGFTRLGWTVLRDALTAQPLVGDAEITDVDRWGEYWEVTGPIKTPVNRQFIIRTDWIIRPLDPRPQFTTAKPSA